MVTRLQRLLSDLGGGDGEGDRKRGGVEWAGDAMGLRGLSGCDSGMGMLARCMLVFSPTAMSLVTQCVLHGTMGVPKDC
jgi:hypothetical protein